MGFWKNTGSPAVTGIVATATGGIGGAVTGVLSGLGSALGGLFGGGPSEEQKQAAQADAANLFAEKLPDGSSRLTRIQGTKGEGAYYLDHVTGAVYVGKSYGGLETVTAGWAQRYKAVVEAEQRERAARTASISPVAQAGALGGIVPGVLLIGAAIFLIARRG